MLNDLCLGIQFVKILTRNYKEVFEIIRLQERDIKLIKLLAEYGLIYSKDTRRIYGNTKRYHEIRLGQLKKEGYIRSKNLMIYLGYKGKDYCEQRGIVCKQVPGELVQRRRISEISKIIMELNGVWECLPSWKIKRSDSRKDYMKRYYANIKSKTGEEYLLYVIHGFKTKTITDKMRRGKEYSVYSLKREIERSAKEKKYMNAIILVEDKETMDLYKKTNSLLNLNKQIVLPYNAYGIFLLKLIGEGINKEEIIRKVTSNYMNSELKVTDFTINLNGYKQAIILIDSDLNKRNKLKNYIEVFKNESQRLDICIICLSKQAKLYHKEFPKCEIITVDL